MQHSPENVENPGTTLQAPFQPKLCSSRAGSSIFTWLNRGGAVLSGICAVHCLVFMLGSIVFGFSASRFFFNPGLRWLLITLVAGFCVASLSWGGKCNRRGLSNWLMVAGLAAIIGANFWGIWALSGEILSLFGGLLLTAGHLMKLFEIKRLRRWENILGESRFPKNLALVFLALACIMTVIKSPSLTQIFPNWQRETTTRLKEGAIGWGLLAQLDVRTGVVGPDLRNKVGTKISIPGFVVPLDEQGKTFLLAPYAGACIHGPPPPINQIVYVTMQSQATPIDPWSWEPIWVTGTLEVFAIDSPFGSAGFKMDGISTEIYR